jgi:hypothetical protein
MGIHAWCYYVETTGKSTGFGENIERVMDWSGLLKKGKAFRSKGGYSVLAAKDHVTQRPITHILPGPLHTVESALLLPTPRPLMVLLNLL